MFMAASGRKTGRLPEPPFAVQIRDTLHRSESCVSYGFQRFIPSYNQTLLICHTLFSSGELRRPVNTGELRAPDEIAPPWGEPALRSLDSGASWLLYGSLR